MEVLGDAVGRDRRSGATALGVPAAGRRYDYRRFCTSAWKVGNFLRHLGVRRGAAVAVADDPLPEPVLVFYGAALLGGVVSFGTDATTADATTADATTADASDAVESNEESRTVDTQVDDGGDVRAIVVPERDLDRWPVGPSTKRVAYGGRPADPSVSYFERDVWSENPTEPPDPVSPDDPLLGFGGTTATHRTVLESAESVVAASDLGPGSTVRVDGSFAEPGVVVAGLVAPLLAGGTTVLAADDVDSAVDEVQDAAEQDTAVPDPDVDPDADVDPVADVDIVVGGPDSDLDVASILTPDA